ncbi:hypothetical protein B9Z65_2376 [Elsinoe australis]|uniref:Uncharacterized protein n=1 Tax=Elsinoe australis TaxID=40998 RepID=A0A2P7ZAI9_9PEZI|nr:hypothetical protein B9Z65_2376 [Elsinoe australis]
MGEGPEREDAGITTALSTVYNLYFVAHASEILVYEPIFPNQELPPRFKLVVSTQPTREGLRGYIDPRHPHAINNLVIDRLGSEEVVAVVRDDGDVDAYTTKHIYQAIERRRVPSSSLSLIASELRPLLHRNVGNSAWGLAIHAEARLIAVSSNNHEFNIFAFGLIDKDDDDTVDESTTKLSGRHRDEHIRFPNGGANIPSISFCNTGHDPEGRYLLTTDISGLTRYWDLHERAGPQGLYIGRTPRESSDFNEDSAGWSVGFLDPRGFSEVDDFHDAAFSESARSAADLKFDSPVWDLTAARLALAAVGDRQLTPMRAFTNDTQDQQSRTPRRNGGAGASLRHSGSTSRRSSGRTFGTPTDDSSEEEPTVAESFVEGIRKVIINIGGQEESTTQETASSEEVDDDDNEEDDDDMPSSPMDEAESSPMDEDSNAPDTSLFPEDPGPPTAQNAFGTTNLLDVVPFNTAAPAPRSRRRMRRELEILRRLYADQYPGLTTLTDEPLERDFYVLFANDSPMCPSLPCPIFIASVQDMMLLQPAATSASLAQQQQHATDHLPLILLGNAFKQPLTSDPEDPGLDIDFFERCALLAQIPSLGVVVVGNQKGKVAVLSGFKSLRKCEIKGPRGMRVSGVKWVYGLRLEAVLPTRRQEREGLRPQAQLYGVAVGPMQGTQEGGVGEERWRVMIMFFDETILSYEIRRERDGGLGVEGLVI